MTYSRSQFGLFSQPSFLAVGDPYNKPEAKGGRDTAYKGRQFQTAYQKRGQTADNWGNKKREYFPLYERPKDAPVKEAYSDPHRPERERRNMLTKKRLTTNGFRYSHPGRKSAGPGDFYGHLGPKWEYLNPYKPVTKDDKPPHPGIGLPQVKTNPSKRGSYGNNWKCLLGPEYEYKTSDFDAPKKLAKEREAENKKKMQEAPFKAMSKTLDFFDQPKRAAVSQIYAATNMPPKKEKDTAPKIIERPFYPSKYPKKGYNATLNKFPEYVPNPIKQAERKTDEEENKSAPWKSVSKPKLRESVPIVLNPHNLFNKTM